MENDITYGGKGSDCAVVVERATKANANARPGRLR
jgi:hypothetical protein